MSLIIGLTAIPILLFIISIIASGNLSASGTEANPVDTTATSPMDAQSSSTSMDTVVKDTTPVSAPKSNSSPDDDPEVAFSRADELYRDGDFAAAFRLFKKSAESGYAQAQFQVGFMYLKGIGTNQAYESAARWFRKSANNGNAEAMRFLGDLYANGDGVDNDIDKAKSWYRKAIAHGDQEAVQALEVVGEE